MYILENIQEYINNNEYDKLLLFMNNNRVYSYSFIEYINYVINKTNNIQLSNVISKYLNDTKDNKDNNDNNEEIKQKRKDANYKNNVIQLCEYKCVVTGKVLNCEVAHIYEFKDCEYDCEKYDKFNGLYLKGDIHKLWDNKYLIIDYDNTNKNIFFRINTDNINLQDNSSIKIKEILKDCNIIFDDENESYTASDNTIMLDKIKELKITININTDYFNYYKNYINKRNH